MKVEGNVLKLEFEDGRVIDMDINSKNGSISTSKIFPQEDWVVLAEYGLIDLLSILSNPDSFKVDRKYVVVGLNKYNLDEVISLGDRVVLSDYTTITLKLLSDESNKMSISSLIEDAKNNKELVAANAIIRDKNKSKLGLNMQTEHISDDVLSKVKANEKKKTGSANLYKGVKVEFVNYFLTRIENIIGIDAN